jgi:colanic acid biosynthesis glycosyl transferase WcaI
VKLHLITNLFAPDELAGASLFSDLALYLQERGHDVRVTCTFSYYPAWRLRPEDVGVSLREESFHGIPVRRVRMHVPERPTGKARMMSDLSFLLSLLRRARFPGWLPDVVITASPMFSQCLAQRFLYAGRRIPRLIVVQDFVVDAALELGLLRLPGLPPILKALERWAFRSAQTLTTISPGMLEKLRGIVGADRRTVFIPNWIHGSLAAEIQRQQVTAPERETGVLFYSGNLGVKQGLPDFLEMYRQTAQGWTLRIHGGGAEAERLRSGLQSGDGVSMGEVLEEREYIRSLLSVSACLVTQKAGVGANFLPSKLLPALATGTPVLAVCDPGSPLGVDVREGGFGAVVPPGGTSGLRAVLERWRAEPGELSACTERARERAVLYARETVLSRYEEELVRFNHREHREHREGEGR